MNIHTNNLTIKKQLIKAVVSQDKQEIKRLAYELKGKKSGSIFFIYNQGENICRCIIDNKLLSFQEAEKLGNEYETAFFFKIVRCRN